MDKLRGVVALPAPDRKRVAAHNHRRVGGKVLVTNGWGGRALLSEAEYRDYLRGLEPGHPLFETMRAGNFLRHAFDFEAAAREEAVAGPLSWRGPSAHLLVVARGRARMSLETARRAVDFAFAAPGPQVTLELSAPAPDKVWGTVWFLVQYARRKSEWSGRPLFLILRAEGGLSAEHADFLRAHAVTRRLSLDLKGRAGSFKPSFAAQRLLARVGPGSGKPEEWVDRWLGLGVEAYRLEPVPAWAGTLDGVRRFLDFYRGVLERVVERAPESQLRDERVLEFLGRAPWRLEGMDLLERLAHEPDGTVLSGENGALPPLGRPGDIRYEDLAGQDAVKAALSAALADNQPLCSQCVYKPHCSLAPGGHAALQGGVWGRTPASPLCALHMGLLDMIFERISQEDFQFWLNKSGVDTPG